MFKTLFLKIKNSNELNNLYEKEKKYLINASNKYLENIITFDHNWDMERCTKEVIFNYNWELVPFNDPEWMFMTNRFRFLEIVGRAYFITKDKKYYDYFEKTILDWIEKNKNIEIKKNTTCRRIDVGIRIEHLIKAIEYFSECEYFNKEVKDKIKESLISQGNYLFNIKDETVGFSKTSNWGVLEYHGLFLLALFIDTKYSKLWIETAKNFLIEALDTQFLDDYVQWELSPMYHNEVVHCYLNFILLCDRFNIFLSSDVRNKIRQIAFTNIKWQKPNHRQPLWGDSDDTDLRDLLTLAAYIFSDSEIKSRAFEKPDFENYFILGKSGFKKYEKIKSAEPSFRSFNFKCCGYKVIRDDWTGSSSFLTFNSKKLGGGHGHDDLLNVTFFAKGKDYLIDCGRYTYTESKERKYLKSSNGHNTLIINGEENSKYKNSWTNESEANFLDGIYFENDCITICNSHNMAYIKQGIIITRNIIKFSRNTFLILDYIFGDCDKNIELKFNTPLNVVQNNNGVNISDLKLLVSKNMNIKIKDAYYSKHYNEKNKSKQVVEDTYSKENTFIYNLFSFEKNVKIEEIQISDQLNNIIPKTVAIALKIKEGKNEYVVLYRASTNHLSRGYFMMFDGKYYIESLVVLKKIKNKYNVIAKT